MKKQVEVSFLPGDLIYVIRDGAITEMRIQYIYVANRNRYHAISENGEATFNFREPGIGRDVFCTKEEAEAALTRIKDFQ